MKRAFSFLELLTITAMLCVLAAVATPMMQRSDDRAKADLAIRNLKTLGAATLMYMNDSDQHFPLASVMRPETMLIGTGVNYPFPSGASLRGIHSGWSTLGRFGMANAQWANAIFPYVGSPTPYYIPGFKIYSPFDEGGYRAETYQTTFTMNGDLHRFPMNGVVNPEHVPLFWTGNGKLTFQGAANSQPVLDCGGWMVSECMFNPTGHPSASGQGTFGGVGQGDVLVTSRPASFWVFSGKRLPILTVDSSAKLVSAGDTVFPNVAPPSTAFKFPFSQLGENGGPSDLNGSRLAYWSCDLKGVISTPMSKDNIAYWCFFRPDRP